MATGSPTLSASMIGLMRLVALPRTLLKNRALFVRGKDLFFWIMSNSARFTLKRASLASLSGNVFMNAFAKVVQSSDVQMMNLSPPL
ncbi:hypothetical protein ACFS07_33445 [Undibacterium arcticum]